MASFTDKRGGEFIASKAFRADIDVGQDKDYQTQLAAIDHLDTLIAHGLPPPIILNSGIGLNLIWALYESLSKTEWLVRARSLKAHLQSIGLRFDAQRTTDYTNGPRVPGTINSKNGQRVTIMRWSKVVWSVSAWDREIPICHPITNYLFAESSQPGKLERLVAQKSKHYDIEVPASGELTADCCAQMAAFRNGDYLSEPEWAMLLNVLTYCDDGEELAHRWSALDPRYREAETTYKFSQFINRTGPTTCDWFRNNFGERCQGCPHQVKSPLLLGRRLALNGHEEPKEPKEPKEPEEPEQKIAKIFNLPKGYYTQNGYIYRNKNDDDGHPNLIGSQLYCTGHSSYEGTRHYEWTVLSKQNEIIHEFKLPRASCNSRTSEFINKVWNAHPMTLDKYITDATYMIDTKEDLKAVYKEFGWHAQNQTFLLGHDLYRQDMVEPTTVQGDAMRLAHHMQPHGSLTEWQKAIRELTAPGMENHIFLSLLSAGAPVHSLVAPDEGGIMALLRSNASGRGKTTALAAAMSLWGAWRKLGVSSSSTPISQLTMFQTLRHLPIAWDETAVKDLDGLANRVFQFSDGSARVRAKEDGSLRNNESRWSTFLLCTSNSEIRRKLSTMKGTTEGLTARVLELEAEISPELLNDGGALLSKFDYHYGHAGPLIIKALLSKPEILAEIHQDIQVKIQARMQSFKWSNNYRYIARAITCAEIGGRLLQRTCLPNLNVERIIGAVETRLDESYINEVNFAEANDPVNYFIREHIGSLVFVGAGIQQPPLRRIAGRYELIDHNKAVLSVPLREWYTWGATLNKSEQELFAGLRRCGHLSEMKKIGLTDATPFPPMTKELCMVINLSPAISEEIETVVKQSAAVIPIKKTR